MLRAFFARAAAVAALCLPALGCSSPDKTAEHVSSQSEAIGAAGASAGCAVDADCGNGCGVCSSGTCTVATTAVTCRPAAAGGCDVAESCDGTHVDCPADAFSDVSVVCHAGDGTVCDPAKNCTGSSAACPAPTFADNTTVCRATAGVCDKPETCDGAGHCPADTKFDLNHGRCRPLDPGGCDVDEVCDGTHDDCPTDQFALNTVHCHAGDGTVCDPVKSCTGTSAACPAPTLADNTTVCRAAAGVCDKPETCDGAGHCPADTKFDLNHGRCRPLDPGGCDVDEVCDGTHDDCPTDQFALNTVHCHAGDGTVCDPVKDCTGTSAACPAPTFASTAVECHSSQGACDPAEKCDGLGHCPTDAKFLPTDPPCRKAIGGDCDKPEFCDGINNACPADESYKAIDNHVCRPVNGLCDVAEECPGGTNSCPADTFKAQNTVCRPAVAGGCDIQEVCTGGSADCPHDDFEPATKACHPKDPNDPCDIEDYCLGGSSVCPADSVAPANAVICRPANPAQSCDQAELCDGTNKGCPANITKPKGSTCDDGIPCTVSDLCDDVGNCHGKGTTDPALLEATCQTNEHVCAITSCDQNGCEYDATAQSGKVCRAASGNGLCDVSEKCDGTNIDCPADVVKPSSTECQPLSCSNGTVKPQILCTGTTALCPIVPDISCGNYACGSPTDCRTTCVTSADCGTAYYCLNNACVPRIGAGQTCKTDAECSTSNSHCVDGVCCDTTCTGQCEACNTVGKVGTCVGVKGDPVSPRAKCTADGTKCDGFCDPSNHTACQFPDTSTSCRDASCDRLNNAAEAESFCTGKGTCNLSDPTGCEPYSCGATACNGDCTADAQCASDAYCASGKCTKKGKPADVCSTDKQCGSGHCADGVCCDTACTGQCEACNQVPDGKAGTCSPVSGQPLGKRTACAASAADPECAGACDGKNRLTCNYPGQGTVCREGSCADGQATVASYCNGHGACPAAFAIACAKGCEGALCAGDQCVSDSDCKDSSQYCAAGACTPKAEPGSSCSSASACKSGFCTDGVCCDSACLGQCEACDTSGSMGTCSAVSKGDSPHGGRSACVSDGSACGGSCDGSARNTCKYPFDTVCRKGSCSAGVGPDDPATSIVEATCIGNGRCPGEQEQLCGADGCDSAGKVCNGACAVDKNACESGKYCAAGECVPKLGKAGVCANDAQCGTGFCVDGVCCNKRCADQCAACDVPGSVGTCTPVSGTAHGGRAACGGVGTCGAACDGTVIASCSFGDEHVTCGEAFCSAGLKGDAPVCDGQGVCAPAKTTACASLACDGAECSTACTADSDCVKNFECKKGQCVPPVLIDAVDKGTCGCGIPGSGARTPGSVLVLLGACLLAATRRRRRRAA